MNQTIHLHAQLVKQAILSVLLESVSSISDLMVKSTQLFATRLQLNLNTLLLLMDSFNALTAQSLARHAIFQMLACRQANCTVELAGLGTHSTMKLKSVRKIANKANFMMFLLMIACHATSVARNAKAALASIAQSAKTHIFLNKGSVFFSLQQPQEILLD